jgi:hypothetical protein
MSPERTALAVEMTGMVKAFVTERTRIAADGRDMSSARRGALKTIEAM